MDKQNLTGIDESINSVSDKQLAHQPKDSQLDQHPVPAKKSKMVYN